MVVQRVKGLNKNCNSHHILPLIPPPVMLRQLVKRQLFKRQLIKNKLFKRQLVKSFKRMLTRPMSNLSKTNSSKLVKTDLDFALALTSSWP